MVPATDARKLAKAAQLDVDEVVIDLEDSVPVSLKNDLTRRAVAEAIAGLAWRAPTVAVRINGIDTPWFRGDIAAVVAGAGERLAAVVIPKVESADSIIEVLAALDGTGARPDVGVEALIETARGVVSVESIAAVSSRLEALIFGAGDYAASMSMPLAGIGAIDTAYPGDQWAYPRSRIAVAAHAFGTDAIDGPFADFRDFDGLAESARRARILGFGGKWAVHPSQVTACTDAFTPTRDELEAAEKTLAVLEAAARAGRGAIGSDGSMIDEASRRQANAVVARAGRSTT